MTNHNFIFVNMIQFLVETSKKVADCTASASNLFVHHVLCVLHSVQYLKRNSHAMQNNRYSNMELCVLLAFHLRIAHKAWTHGFSAFSEYGCFL